MNPSRGAVCRLKYRGAPRHHTDPVSQGESRPPLVRQVRVAIHTAAAESAQTNEALFLGLGGREFRLTTGAEDLASGASVEFILGLDANVLEATSNDPRALDPPAPDAALTLLDVDTYPAYLRKGGTAEWILIAVDATVTFEGPCHDPFYWAAGPGEGGMVTRYRTFSSTTGGRQNPPMAVHLTGVCTDLRLGGAAGMQCALVRTLPG